MTRVETDVKKLVKKGYKVEIINDNMHEFYVEVHGPKESFYQGYVWNVRVKLPDNYPNEPPIIQFVDKIYHCNIDETIGNVCVNVLNETWSPMIELVAVFELFLPQILKFPNPNDPANVESAAALINDPAIYKARVKEFAERYAKPEKANNEEMLDEEMEDLNEAPKKGNDGEMLDEEMNEAEMLAMTNDKMEKLAIEEDKYNNAPRYENVPTKAGDPSGRRALIFLV